MAKILIATYGSRGDVQPMLALAMGLKSAGHTITMIAPPDFVSWIQEQEIEAHTIGRDMRALIEEYGAKVMAHPFKVISQMGALIKEDLKEQHHTLIPLAEKHDLIISSSLQLAAFSAAEYWNIPYTYVVFCPNLIPSKKHMPMIYPWPFLPDAVNQLFWKSDLKVWDYLLGGVLNALRQEHQLPPVKDTVHKFLSPHPILAAYAELAPCPPDIQAEQTGAFHLPAASHALPTELQDFLNSGSAPFYIGFGSMNDGKAAYTTEIIAKVAQKSHERFVVSKGWADLGQKKLPENVYLTDSVPHELLFPRLKGVVHHGGAGTTAMAARSGMPQIILPHLLDQYYWGQQIYRRGLGIKPFGKRHLTAAKLDNALQRLDREDFRLRAQALGKRLQRHDGVQNAVQFIEKTLL